MEKKWKNTTSTKPTDKVLKPSAAAALNHRVVKWKKCTSDWDRERESERVEAIKCSGTNVK